MYFSRMVLQVPVWLVKPVSVIETLSVQLETGWLDALLLFTSTLNVDSTCEGGEEKISRNNYKGSCLNDQIFSE